MKVNHLIAKTNTEIIQYHLTALVHKLVHEWAKAAPTWDTDKVHYVGATKVIEDLSKFSPLIKVTSTYKRVVGHNPHWRIGDKDVAEFNKSATGNLAIFIHGLSGGDISVYVPVGAVSGEVRSEHINSKIDGLSMAHFEDSKKLLEMLITDNILVSAPALTEKWTESE